MASWREVLTHLVDDVEDHFDALKYRMAYALGGPDPIKIVPYRGFGNQERMFLKGRVLEDPEIVPAKESDSLWDNLVNMYKRFESDEVPHARLVARFQDVEHEIVADEEGMFEIWIKPTQPLPSDQLWHDIELELIEPQSDEQEGPVTATGKVLVPPESASYIVISDIDDTVIQTDATHVVKMARNVFLGNAYTRLPFPGVSAFYRALHAGASGHDRNPLFFLSSSPWNLYDLLVRFFELHDIPQSPALFLRNWGISEQEILPTKHKTYKMQTVRRLLDLYEEMPFILIGDSGQEDPEIYHETAQTYGERIHAIYVRNVSHDLERPKAIRKLAEEVKEVNSTLILADDSLVMAKHAAEAGWIRETFLPEIAETKEKDEEEPGPIDQLLGEEEEAEGPTVVVEGESPEKGKAVEKPTVEAAMEVGDEEQEGPPTVIVDADDE